MIVLGHYDPERHSKNGDGNNNAKDEDSMESRTVLGGDSKPMLPMPTLLNKCKPGICPNCYTYSAIMNALVKSFLMLQVISVSGARSLGT